MDRTDAQKGFSLIEMLMVTVIIGLLASIGVPSMLKAREAAQRGATIGTLRTMHTDQLMYYSSKGRYARLNELNSTFKRTFGTTVGSRLYKSNYMYLMSPSPSLKSLKTGYQIVVYSLNSEYLYPSFSMNQNGEIQSIYLR
ncbi:MAG TPA: type II secretion system protein [Pyrinomonadaceae bacterium]|nr:type II secretion system protein [Pyrinomonadaceae bacterium]